MTHPNMPLLLLGGAGLPSWIWDDLRTALNPNRASVVASRPSGDASLLDYARSALDSAPWQQFVIVAHSSGGVIATALTGLAPQRVGGFLGVAAVVPPPGASFITSMPFPNRLILSAVMRIAGTRPPEKAIRTTLATGVDRATADRIVRDFIPESPSLYRHKIGDRPSTPHRGYIYTAADKELPYPVQCRFRTNLDPQWESTLDTGHLPMLEDASSLGEAVQQFLDHAQIDAIPDRQA